MFWNLTTRMIPPFHEYSTPPTRRGSWLVLGLALTGASNDAGQQDSSGAMVAYPDRVPVSESSS
jgi:hypothetical protein